MDHGGLQRTTTYNNIVISLFFDREPPALPSPRRNTMHCTYFNKFTFNFYHLCLLKCITNEYNTLSILVSCYSHFVLKIIRYIRTTLIHLAVSVPDYNMLPLLK